MPLFNTTNLLECDPLSSIGFITFPKQWIYGDSAAAEWSNHPGIFLDWKVYSWNRS